MPLITVRDYPQAVDPPRGESFKNRHTPAAVAADLGIPQDWVWFWIWSKQLNASPWLAKTWVNLDKVREVAGVLAHADLAYEATSEPIRSSKGAEFAREHWGELPREFSYLVEAE